MSYLFINGELQYTEFDTSKEIVQMSQVGN